MMTPLQSAALPDDLEPLHALQLSRAPIAARYLAALLMTGFATIIAIGLDTKVTIPNLSLVFVIPVVITAVTVGLGPSLFSAVLGALAYNFFLTEPRYSLAVDDPANIWAICLLFVVGCMASAVASIARRQANDALLLRQQATILQAYSREVLASAHSKSIMAVTAETLESLFQVPAVVVLMSQTRDAIVERRGAIAISDVEMDAARSALANGKPVVAGVYPFDASRVDFWPLVTPAGEEAVIGLAFDPDDRPRKPGMLVEILASMFALALDSRRPVQPQ